jgi:hypothetical protein
MVGAAAFAAYLLGIRPRQLRWGATDEEAARAMPGDDVVKQPTFSATRAVTIEAKPEQIWPWLVQMGFHRAGWYSYDWVDNLGRRSSERIIPEFQHVHVGDLIPMSPGGKVGVCVRDFESNRWLLWWDQKGKVTWLWGLDPLDDTGTRLISRVRMKYDWASPVILFELLFDVGDIIMMRKCMLGQAAGRARSTTSQRSLTPGARCSPDGDGSKVLGSQISTLHPMDP